MYEFSDSMRHSETGIGSDRQVTATANPAALPSAAIGCSPAVGNGQATTKAPVVSVLFPVYNSKPFLAEAIESILTQTFDDFELLIIDDGSTDGSTDIIHRYSQLDGRIRALSSARIEDWLPR